MPPKKASHEDDQLSMVSFKTVQFSAAKGEDFHDWVAMFSAMVEPTIKEHLLDPKEVELDPQEKQYKDLNALLYRRLVLSTKELPKLIVLAAEGDGRGAWERLFRKFAPKSRVRAQEIFFQLVQMRYDVNTDIEEYLVRAELAQQRIARLGVDEKVGDGMLKALILNGLPPEFDNVKAIIRLHEDIPTEEFKNMLRNHYEHNFNQEYSHLHRDRSGYEAAHTYAARAHVLNGSAHTFQGYCGRCGEKGHKMRDCEVSTRANHPMVGGSAATPGRGGARDGGGRGMHGGGRGGKPSGSGGRRQEGDSADDVEALHVTVPRGGYIPSRQDLQDIMNERYSAKQAAATYGITEYDDRAC